MRISVHRNVLPLVAALGLFSSCTDTLETTALANEVVVPDSVTTVTTDQASYAAGQDVIVSYTGMSGAASDWISIAAPSANGDQFVAWAFTNGGTDGQLTFSSLPTGQYEARAFFDWEGTHSFTAEQHSATFQVGTSVTTSASNYASGDPVVVSFSGMPGTATDWVGIALPSSDNEDFVAWMYTGGGTSGTVSIPGVPSGTYVARVFPNDGFDLAGESASFTVGLGSITVMPAQSTYASTDQIIVHYTGLSDPTDWIGLAPVGADIFDFTQWSYAGGGSGTLTFSPETPGMWEVRAFLHDGFQLAATGTFTVTGTSSITEQHSGTSVTVTYTNAPGNALDWVALSPAASADTSFTYWAYINGSRNGTYTFNNVAAGDYVARVYSNDTFNIVTQSAPFTMGNAAMVSTAGTFATDAMISVDYQGLPGNATDWIAIAAASSPDDQFIDWVYTGGQNAGTATFAGLPAGDYEARAYLMDRTDTLVARSTFTVIDPP